MSLIIIGNEDNVPENIRCQDDVELISYLSDEDYYSALSGADIFISTSAVENSSNAVIEGLSFSKKIFDIPIKRSSHTKPIPKGGGWIIVLCIIVVKFLSEGGVSLPSFTMYLSIIGLAILSWIDDIKNVRVITRLLFQFLIIFLLFFSITGAGFAIYTNFFVTLLFVWFINIFNFMDGIDGITPSVTITLILGVLVIRSLELHPTNWIFEFGIIFSCLVANLRVTFLYTRYDIKSNF
mgnify:CR=1 FL=1